MLTFSKYLELTERVDHNSGEMWLKGINVLRKYLVTAHSKIKKMLLWGLSDSISESHLYKEEIEYSDEIWGNREFMQWIKGRYAMPHSDKKSGYQGTCFIDASRKAACKITEQEDEAELAILCIANKVQEAAVKDIVQLTMSEHYSYYAILQDVVRVATLADDLGRALNAGLHYVTAWINGWKDRKLDIDSPVEFTKIINNNQSISQKDKQILILLLNVVIKVLDKTGRLWTDLKTSNIGFDQNNNFILFDLGMNTTVFEHQIPMPRNIIIRGDKQDDSLARKRRYTDVGSSSLKNGTKVEYIDDGGKQQLGTYIGYSSDRGYIVKSNHGIYHYFTSPDRIKSLPDQPKQSMAAVSQQSVPKVAAKRKYKTINDYPLGSKIKWDAEDKYYRTVTYTGKVNGYNAGKLIVNLDTTGETVQVDLWHITPEIINSGGR